jgi:hypothetical protein
MNIVILKINSGLSPKTYKIVQGTSWIFCIVAYFTHASKSGIMKVNTEKIKRRSE